MRRDKYRIWTKNEIKCQLLYMQECLNFRKPRMWKQWLQTNRKDNTVQKNKRHKRISSNISIIVYIARWAVSTKINIGTILKENNYARAIHYYIKNKEKITLHLVVFSSQFVVIVFFSFPVNLG